MDGEYGILPKCILVGEDVVEELAHFEDLVWCFL